MGGYPSTTIELINNTAKKTADPLVGARQKAIILTACASDKGPEEFKIVEKDFTKIYGGLSFSKYGQAQIQANAIVNSGGGLMHHRVVAPNSTLAHIALTITVSKVETPKTDADGANLYLDPDGNETTAADGNEPIMITSAKVSFGTMAITDQEELKKYGNNYKAIAIAIKHTLTDWATADPTVADSITFPWCVLFETGRGKSKKKIRIVPDYTSSKSSSWTKYLMSVMEDNTSTDNVLMFSLDPDVIDSQTKENRFIDAVIAARSVQLRCMAFEDSIYKMYEVLSTFSGYSVEYLKENDVLFGCTRKGIPLTNIAVADGEGSVSLNNIMGIDLLGGDNGDFGDYPLETPAYSEALVDTFNGRFSPDIYDINNSRINAIFDANYPVDVKRSIESLIQFRDDIFYFRDLGLDNLTTPDDIVAADVDSLKSYKCASYHNYYDIFDPTTKKQVTVTCMYDLTQLFIAHEAAGICRPFAGLLYGITFNADHIIQDTINFIPKKIPGYDQISVLRDANINYIMRYNGVPTMDTEITSDELDSDFSYINNILAIQDLIRLIRERCPKTRYTFKDGDDFTSYKKDVENLMATRQSNFATMTLEFMGDDAQLDDKTVYATIGVGGRDFIEKENFKIIAI